ncbi:LacI family DNA-binding transcriptional regulator (plasmid) [Lactobacillus johnsonii]
MKQHRRLYSQTEIAKIAGVSKATVSRYISKLDVSATTKDNAKLYDETVLKQVQEAYKIHKNNKNERLSTIQLLQEQISQLKEENTRLIYENKQLNQKVNQKDQELNEDKNKIAELTNKTIELAQELTQLTNQAQRLNVLDKKEIQPPKKKHWWQ